MGSDNYYDGFAYHSSQDDLDIEYQIDLFEISQYKKLRRQYKQKVKISSYPFSMKTRRSQHPLIKICGMNDKKTSKTEQNLFRYTHYPEKRNKRESKTFECDQQFPTSSNVPSELSLKADILNNFSNFRRHFYYVNHQRIKSSFKSSSSVEIINIRPAPIKESVQFDFMKKLNESTSYFPHLVYHGTRLESIKSILHYGFLIPNQAHPTNSKAPIIATKNGSAYGSGIYCSETADYSLTYLNDNNTLLACAAVPKRNDAGNVERSHGNILVLSHVSEIIPLFLIDIRYSNGSGQNRTWYNKWYNENKNVQEDPNKSFIVAKKYLRKVLNCMNDDVQRNKRYRRRKNNRNKVQRYDQYPARIFEPLNEELQF